jgi:2-polyprenyl-3-methyl-5-hydroxy-6-metoxy-1,4-benzoquinol methylase
MTPPMTGPTPERIFQTLTAYQTSAALSAAIQLDVFTQLAAGTDTLAPLARATGASERGLRALLNHLVSDGLLTKQGERYRCGPEAAAFLDKKRPSYMGSMTGFLNSTGLVRCFEDLAAAVKRGGTSEPAGGTVSVENPVWIDFARAMVPMARALAPGLAEAVLHGGTTKRVLDVAAGHGIYGIEFARRVPSCEVTFLDWSNVLTVTREHAEQAGVGSRAKYLPGSAFDVDFGRGFDAILVTNFLHHFAPEACTKFLAKCRAALAPGGRVAVLEFALEADRVTPAGSAGFDLVMIATTREGNAHTIEEYGKMFTAAGLQQPERHDIPGGSQTALVAGAAK